MEAQDELEEYAAHFRKYGDAHSLRKVIELLDEDVDTARVRQLLGEPIATSFDYRYTVDSTGANGCTVGGVFHIDENGQIDNKWLGEICE